MKGDFSTERFNPSKHYNRVLKQQGRVDLDSDWNEQAAISQHFLRTFIVDLIGPSGGPLNNCGFELVDPQTVGLKATVGDFVLGMGRYYVDGLLVENEQAIYYGAQPDLPTPDKLVVGKTYLAYLDVWERHVTYLEDDQIREVALGGPDTTTRVKTLWQVRVLESTGSGSLAPNTTLSADKLKQLAEMQTRLDQANSALANETDTKKIAELKKTMESLAKQIAALKSEAATGDAAPAAPAAPLECGALLQPLLDWRSGTMTARLKPGVTSDSPCVLPVESRYRGMENHLYRIEVHHSGDTSDPNNVPTFKWSRENGSIATRWLATTGNQVRIGNSRDFAAGQWIEFTTEVDDLLGRPGPLTRITRIDGDLLTVEKALTFQKEYELPKVRRWDQTANDALTLLDGAIAITPGTGETGWIEIEDGIEVQFAAGAYRSGDYWLITARAATGQIDWPDDQALEPFGIVHHYAPLFMAEATGKDPFCTLKQDCRCKFASLPCVK